MLLKSEEIPTSVSRVQQLVENHYGIHAMAKPLPGEIDDNYYLITNQGEEYVLKIAPPDSDHEHLQFQNALAIQLKDAEVALPNPVITVDMLATVLEAVVMPMAEVADELIIIETDFVNVESDLLIRFWVLPDAPVSTLNRVR